MQTAYAQKTHFPLVMENGSVTECEALLLAESPCGTKNYLVYTDNSTNSDGSLTLFASSYRKHTVRLNGNPLSETDLNPLTSKEEWAFVEAALQAAIAE